MKGLKLIMSACLFFQQFAFPLAGVCAKNKKSEKQFLEELQAPIDEGGPILNTKSSSKKKKIPKMRTPGKPIGSVRMKEAPMYAAAESVSRLDKVIGPIRLKGAPLSTFLDVISAQSKVNFILSEGLEKKRITVFLRRTTVREALELLLRVKGLTYQRIGKSHTYVVTKRTSAGPSLITKIYTLNYIPLIPIGSAEADMASITSQDVSSSQIALSGEDPGEAKSSPQDGIAIIQIIRSVLSKAHGKLATDPRTNALIITDMPEVFPQVEQIIAELDKKAPQILIEAQVVEINTDRVNELGIEWGGARGEMAYFVGPARLTDYGLRPGMFSGDQWKNFYPTNFEVRKDADDAGSGEIDPIFATGTQSPKGVFYGIFSLAQLQAIFRALISRGEARYLGKPKIVAMNNTTAIITISRDAAVGTGTSATSAGGESSATSVERRRIGLTLKVTPQVNKEGYVTLIVQPSYSDTTPSGISAQGQTILDPISRGASTLVRVKNGQTVVIGGMLSSTESKTVKKVPLLGYIPIIGWLFTSVSSRRINTDLVIFVTPTILVD